MTDTTASMSQRPFSRMALAGLVMAIVTDFVMGMAALGFRMEWWGYGSSLKILRGAVSAGVVAVVLSLLGIVMTLPARGRRGLVVSISALLIAAPTLAMPLYWAYSKSQLPPIQDISTDLETPPDFWDAPTSRIHPGEETAGQQRAAYPDIQPVVIAGPMGDVFDQAVNLVREREWKLVAAEAGEGRIEATVTTFWYGFKDDVVIRLTQVDAGTRVDMRSASRFGSGGDGGSNANRVREFLAALRKRMAE